MVRYGGGKVAAVVEKAIPTDFCYGGGVQRGNSPRACRSAKADFCKRVCGIRSDDSSKSQAVLVLYR